MLSAHKITSISQAGQYFDKSNEYYTEKSTNYDRWHGDLSKTLGLEGEVSQEQFLELLKLNEDANHSVVGVDLTFSAPKSVSLAMAMDDQTKADMIAAHQAAVKEMLEHIETEEIKVRVSGNSFHSNNLCAAEFVHFTARPTAENNFVSDLDLHSHVVVANLTQANGKLYSLDLRSILDSNKVKELGLMYRAELMAQLHKRGYATEVTDRNKGFFELKGKGIDRDLIMAHSHRRQVIEKVMREKGISNGQVANLTSRKGKKEAVGTEKDVFDKAKVELKERKIELERIDDYEFGKDSGRGVEESGDRRTGYQRARNGERPREADYVGRGRQPDLTNTWFAEGRGYGVFGEKQNVLPKLSVFNLDQAEEGSHLLLSDTQLSDLADRQCSRVKRRHLFRKAQAGREARVREIDRVVEKSVKEIEQESYAFKLTDLKQKILKEGMELNIKRDELLRGIERAGVVNLGILEGVDADGNKVKDVYVTTEKNIQTEELLKERVVEGKGLIRSKVLTMEESRALLHKIETKANEGVPSDKQIWTERGEQGDALHTLMTCEDQFIAWDGLAGTGKTTAAERVHAACDELGIKIYGACFTGKAADGLEADSGINSRTLHSFLEHLEKNGTPPEGSSGGRSAPVRQIENVSVSKAVKDNIVEALNNGKPLPKEHHIPKRSMTEKVKRAAKEIAAEGLMDAQNAAQARAHLRYEDEKLYREQLKEMETKERGAKDLDDGKEHIKQEWDFSKVKHIAAGEREIWAIDEAGLVDNHLMKQLTDAAKARGAQVLLLGDPQQLPSVGGGEAMKTMENAGMATAELSDIRRQKDNQELLKAVNDSVKGDIALTYEYLEKSGHFHEVKDPAERVLEISKEVTKAKLDDYKNNLLLVSTNDQRNLYNSVIRSHYVDRGELDEGKEFDITVKKDGDSWTEKRNFAVNDRMIFLKNDNQMGVKNGTMATIEKIDGNKITAKTDAGKTITFDITKYNQIDHSYAVTNYKAQGMSIKNVYVDAAIKGGSQQTRNAFYVDISRAKLNATVWTDNKEKLKRQTVQWAKKITSKDFQDKINQYKQFGIRNQDRWKSPETLEEHTQHQLDMIRKHTRRTVSIKEQPEPEKEIGMQTTQIQPTKTVEKTQEKTPEQTRTREPEQPAQTKEAKTQPAPKAREEGPTTAEMNHNKMVEDRVFKAQQAHDRMVGQMPVGAGASIPRPQTPMNTASGRSIYSSPMSKVEIGGMAKMQMGAGKTVAEAGAAIGEAIKGVGTLAAAIPVVGVPIKAVTTATGEGVKQTSKVAGAVVDVAEKAVDTTVTIGKVAKQGADIAVGQAKSLVQQAAQAGEKSGKEHEPLVRHIPYPWEQQQSYDHDHS